MAKTGAPAGRYRSRRVGARVALGFIIMAGAVCAVRLPVLPSPEPTAPALSVLMHCPGLSPEQTERQVTRSVEEIVRMTAGIRNVGAVSYEGGLKVNAVFDPDEDPVRIRADIAGRLQAFQEIRGEGDNVPDVEIGIPVHHARREPFVTLCLGGGADASLLTAAARGMVGNELRAIEGLSRIEFEGEPEPEIRVVLAPDGIERYGITPEMLAQRLRVARTGGASSAYRTESTTPPGLSIPEHARRINDLPVRILANGGVVRVGDCADVKPFSGAHGSRWRVNGLPAILIRLFRKPEADPAGLVATVQGKMSGLAHRLPDGVRWEMLEDQGTEVRLPVPHALKLAIISLVLVAVLSGLVSGGLSFMSRTALVIVAVAAGTLVCLSAAGMTLNTHVLLGIVLGCGVIAGDPGIVRYPGNGDRSLPATKNRMVPREGWRYLPLAGSAAGLAIMWFVRVVQRTHGDVGLGAIGAGLVSLCGAYMVVSALLDVAWASTCEAARLPCRDKPGNSAFDWMNWWSERRRTVARLIAVEVVGLPLWILPVHLDTGHPLFHLYLATFGSNWYRSVRSYGDLLLGGVVHLAVRQLPIGERLKELPGTIVVADIQLPPGSSSERIATVVEAMEFTALRIVGDRARVETNITENIGRLRVVFDEVAGNEALAVSLKEELTGFAAGVGNTRFSIAGIGPAFETGQEAHASFVVRLRGYNYVELGQFADQLHSHLGSEPRIHDMRVGARSFERRQEICLQCRRESRETSLLAPGDVIQALPAMTGTTEACRLIVDGREVPVRVYPPRTMTDDNAAEEFIRLPGGRLERLCRHVDGWVMPRDAAIVREDREYLLEAGFCYDGPEAHGRVIVEELIESFPLPRGYTLVLVENEVRGEATAAWHAAAGIGVAFLAGLLVMAALSESWFCLRVISVTGPLSLAGFSLSCLIWGYPLWFWSVGSFSLVTVVGFHIGYRLAEGLPHRCNVAGSSGETGLKCVGNAVVVALIAVVALIPWSFFEATAFFARCGIGGVVLTFFLDVLFLPPLLMRARRT